ncbi:MAG: endopeptidase La [Acidobacteriia bacterium]|nr:endopeptidase La [Methyloceanibacter sp.]MCL6491545.1 endopeptidase La [Terriglobia bacterium]
MEERSPGIERESSVAQFSEGGLILIPVRNLVLFPGTVMPLSVGRPESRAAAQEAIRREKPVGVLLQTDPAIDKPTENDLYRVGTVAEILRFITAPDGSHNLILRGLRRFRLKRLIPGFPFLMGDVEELAEAVVLTPDIEARMHLLRTRMQEAIQLMPNVPPEIAGGLETITSPTALADFISSLLDIRPDEKQKLLETLDVKQRLDQVLAVLEQRLQVLRISKEIGEKTQESLSAQQREHILREQLRQIQKELGGGEERSAEFEELREAIERAGMPEDVLEHSRKELRRLERMPEGAAEYAMLRTYLDWLAELPWAKLSEERIDIAEARRILDEDHYDLAKVKQRILEYLAVRKLNPSGKGPILCFVGPPGVGKTSLGQSIARATGRQFARISLGGLHDEAEIRGHRRTYIGALPGNIIQAIRKAGTRNPVLMLDEIDKLGVGFHGDPSSALLEVLDPEQNRSFRDNYLGVPFDLSQVMFIATANVQDSIPAPLLDRMEILSLPGYTEDEKLEIAKRYLINRQLRENGLTAEQCSITDDALRRVIRNYTREAGCRNLEREIGAICRRVAMRIAEGVIEKARIDVADLAEILGPSRYENEVAARTSVPGVATGLAWTPTGGDILFVEAARVPGNGRLILTGHLGDVMKESAQAALSLVKARATELGIDPAVFEKSDIHIHVPAGAIPKDGPSAGITMFVSLASLLTGKNVRNDVAMTGEISLRGLVLPIGGVKEKVLAAVRAGIHTVLLPERNKKDLEDVPEDVRKQVEFVWLHDVDDAMRAALSEPPARETQVAASG